METESIQKRPIPYDELVMNFPFLKDSINLEIKLDMEIAEIVMAATLPQVTGFYNIVRIKGSAINLGKDILEVHKDSLKTLYSESIAMSQATGAYVTAVKIWLGLKADLKMILLFEPICIQKNIENNYIVYDSGKIYYYDESEPDNKLKFKNAVDAGSLKKRYRDNIEVLHLNETVFRDFVIDQDTEAVIYPFQIIFTLLSDNIVANDCITLRNSIATNHQSGNLQNQHSLLLFTTKDADKDKDLRSLANFKDKYANRSHLCPPGCREIADLDLY